MRAPLLLALLGPACLLTAAAAQDKKGETKDDVMIIGQIVPNDLPDKTRRHPCKIHTLRFAKDREYQIDLQSKDFDTFLRIEDADGKQLAADDDGGEGLNSRLRFQPPKDDVYHVIVTSFAGGAGMYVLKVQNLGPAKAKK